jgi:fructose transport system substrate-binding protein
MYTFLTTLSSPFDPTQPAGARRRIMTAPMSDPPSSRRRVLSGLGVVLVLLGTACGSDKKKDTAASSSTTSAAATSSSAAAATSSSAAESSPATSSSAAGSSSAAAGADTPVIVGLVTKTLTNPFFVAMQKGAEKAAAAQPGVKLLTGAGTSNSDNASQVTVVENMINAGAKGILLVPADSKAIVPSVAKWRAAGVVIIALDTPTEPLDATDGLFATDNFKAGVKIGEYAKATFAGKPAKIVTLDIPKSISVGYLRHNGFLNGFGDSSITAETTEQKNTKDVVCEGDSDGDQAKGQKVMETCLQKAPDVNLVYAINEPAAVGAYTALKAAGKEKNVLIVAVDGGCDGVKAIQDGKIAATSQQYPLKMAQIGVEAIVKSARGGEKPKGYTDTGVELIAAKPVAGVESKDVQFGLDNCW